MKFGKINKKYFSGGVVKFGGAWPTLDVARASDFLGCIGKKLNNFFVLTSLSFLGGVAKYRMQTESRNFG